MAKKIIGAVLIIAGALVLGLLIASGFLFPHIAGPAVLIAAGVLLLAVKKKGEES